MQGSNALLKIFTGVADNHLEEYLLPSSVSQQPEESELKASTQKQTLADYRLSLNFDDVLNKAEASFSLLFM